MEKSFTIDIHSIDDDDTNDLILVSSFSEEEKKELKIIIINEVNDMIEMGRDNDDIERRTVFEMLANPAYSVDMDDHICLTYIIPTNRVELFDKIIPMELMDGYLSPPIEITVGDKELYMAVT